MSIVLRTGFNYDRDAASLESGVSNIDPETGEVYESKTQQHFKDEVDINEIVRRFGLTHTMPEAPRLPTYGDFTGISDYKTAMDAVVAARDGFMELPAELRATFENDPQRLLDFLSDDKNRAKAEELGLVVKKPEVTRDVVQAVDELAARLVPSGDTSEAKGKSKG